MTDDVAICDRCIEGVCDDCAGWAWCEATRFISTCDCAEAGHRPCGPHSSPCDCAESGHELQRDIAEDQAADQALTAHFEERA